MKRYFFKKDKEELQKSQQEFCRGLGRSVVTSDVGTLMRREHAFKTHPYQDFRTIHGPPTYHDRGGEKKLRTRVRRRPVVLRDSFCADGSAKTSPSKSICSFVVLKNVTALKTATHRLLFSALPSDTVSVNGAGNGVGERRRLRFHDNFFEGITPFFRGDHPFFSRGSPLFHPLHRLHPRSTSATFR